MKTFSSLKAPIPDVTQGPEYDFVAFFCFFEKLEAKMNFQGKSNHSQEHLDKVEITIQRQ